MSTGSPKSDSSTQPAPAELANDFLFNWSDELSVGIAEVDEQHLRLLGFVNELHRAIRDRHGREASRQIIVRLAEYTRTHFVFEEGLMRVTKYPNFDAHKQQHDALMEQVAILQNKLDNENAPISFELLHFLKNWLTKHISESDTHFGDYFQQVNLDQALAVQKPTVYQKPWWKFW